MNAPKAYYEIIYNGTNITTSISQYIISFSYTDKSNNEADELEILLEDSELLWQNEWYPTKGDSLSAKIVYLGNTLNCGTFTVDEITTSGSRDSGETLSIKAIAASINSKIRTKNSYAHENKTLREIANTIASKHKLTVQGVIEDIRISRETQYNETDLHFLKRIANEYGYTFSIKNDLLVFTDIYQIESKAEALTIFRSEVIAYSISDKTSNTYNAIKLKYHNHKKSEVIEHQLQETQEAFKSAKADTLELRLRLENEQQAELKCKAALYRLNSLQQSGNISLSGNPLVIAGNCAQLVNFGMFSGKYYIKQSTHSVDQSGGYLTNAEIKRTGLVDKSKKKHYSSDN